MKRNLDVMALALALILLAGENLTFASFILVHHRLPSGAGELLTWPGQP